MIIIEYAAYTRGEIATLAQAIAPNIAIITGLTEQHLGLFGSFEAIIAAKSELVKALPPHGKVFYAADDAGAERIVRAAARNDLREVSFSAKALLPELDEVGRLEITLPVASETAGKQSKQSSKGVRVKTQLIGKQYAGAIAAAVVVARQEGCSEQALRRSLEQFEPTGNFISTKFLPAGTQIIDDGGSCNPAGFLAACELAAAIRKQPRWLLFSGVVDLGDQEQAVHERLAIAAEPVFDRVLFVGEAGVAAFVQVFGDRLVSERAQVLELLEQLPQAVLLLIEGRMPGWVQEKLTQLTAVALSQDAGAKK